MAFDNACLTEGHKSEPTCTQLNGQLSSSPFAWVNSSTSLWLGVNSGSTRVHNAMGLIREYKVTPLNRCDPSMEGETLQTSLTTIKPGFAIKPLLPLVVKLSGFSCLIRLQHPF